MTRETSHPDFVRRYMAAQPGVRAFVLSFTGDFHLAEDALQETAVAAWEQYASYDPARPFEAWLLGIARHKALEMLRRKGRQNVLPDDVVALLADETPRIAEESALRRSALFDCLKKLSERSRRLVGLRFDENLSAQEIAGREGVSLVAARKMLTRARTFLLDCTRHALSEGAR